MRRLLALVAVLAAAVALALGIAAPAQAAPSISVTAIPVTDVASSVGQTVAYAVRIRNDGDVSLTNLEMAIDGVPTLPPFDLAVDQGTVFAGFLTVTQAHLDAGSITLVAAVANSPTTVSGSADIDIAVTQSPALATTASADVASVAAVGDPVQFTVSATNTGNVTLSGLSVTAGALTLTCGATTLAPGAATTCAATYLTTQPDLDARRIRPTFLASAASPAPVAASVTSTSSATVDAGLAATGGTVHPAALPAALGMLLLGGLLVQLGRRTAAPGVV